MAANKGLITTKLKLSAQSVWRVMIKPQYAIIAIVLALVFFEIVYWAFNSNIITLVLGSGLGVGEKIMFLLSPLKDIFVTAGLFVGVLTLLVAAVQGVNLALLLYTVRHQRKLNAGAIGGGSIAGMLAVFGLGCSACGTSLLIPIVAVVASASAVVIAETLTIVAPLLAVIVGLIAMYYLGIQVANVTTTLNQGKR